MLHWETGKDISNFFRSSESVSSLIPLRMVESHSALLSCKTVVLPTMFSFLGVQTPRWCISWVQCSRTVVPVFSVDVPIYPLDPIADILLVILIATDPCQHNIKISPEILFHIYQHQQGFSYNDDKSG